MTSMITKVTDKANKKFAIVTSRCEFMKWAKTGSKMISEAIKTNIGTKKATKTLKTTDEALLLPR